MFGTLILCFFEQKQVPDQIRHIKPSIERPKGADFPL